MRNMGLKIKLLLLIVPLLCATWRTASADTTLSSSITFDKAEVPPIFEIARFSTNVPYGQGNLVVCGSTSNTLNGACPTSSADSPTGNPLYGGTINLKFTSSGDGLVRDIPLRGFRQNGCTVRYLWDNTGCALLSWPMDIYYRMDHSILNRIPVGNWQGTLIMTLRHQAESASPQINLNLINNRPGTTPTASASGRTVLDMCLYDGGSSANRVSLIFQDEGSSALGRISGAFSVYKDSGNKSRPIERIDYNLQIVNPTTGKTDNVTNGMEINWTNTNAHNIQRQVVLFGIPGISLCVPAPITVITPSFLLSGKSAGHYTGILRVIYTPSTQSTN